MRKRGGRNGSQGRRGNAPVRAVHLPPISARAKGTKGIRRIQIRFRRICRIHVHCRTVETIFGVLNRSGRFSILEVAVAEGICRIHIHRTNFKFCST